ncbi:hypothetical protein B0A52_00290 [Exophiala mesophila]|uniref:Alpha/beta hydrolase fold-3 domain-containing protein n=1 Tax=Exophiala mesophila TaxID=212818 RepID=A0A438NJN3_EXOME|nr:hypothetical protein B0A52_00290 [Exophiala mesophila]
MREKPKLSTGEYLQLTYAVGFGGAYYVFVTLIRIGQALSGTTRDQYKIWATKNGVKEDLVEIDSNEGIWGCWLGRNGGVGDGSNKGKTLLWFHGGGYVGAAAEPHFVMLWAFIQEAKARGETLRVLILEYDLAPHRVYPAQLRQATLALQYLLSTGLKPSEILIGGDSAGGNLALGLLLHLSQPHPEIPPFSLTDKLAGAILVSPWVKLQTDSDSYARNRHKDALNVDAIRSWAASFLGKSTTDKYNTPVQATKDDWKDVKVEKLVVTSGSDELLVDDIRTFVDILRKARPDVEYLEAAGEAHDALVMDRAFGLKHELKSEKFLSAWIMARLK